MKNTLLYFTKRFLLFCSPIILLILVYFFYDPFHVLYTQASYGSNFLKTYNRNKISTNVYLENSDKQNFNSFIFGSSRSSAFLTQEWKKHLKGDNTYHFDAFNDNISGMEGKIRYISKNGSSIKNAIIVIDNDSFSETFDESESIVHIKDYRWSGENPILYHLTFFKAFFKKQYFISFLDLKLFKTFRPFMEEFFKFKYFYTDVNNDFLFPENVEQIKLDSIGYYNTAEFKNRTVKPMMLEANIKNHHIASLKAISEVFKNQKSNVKVIIAPLYNQRRYNPIDLEILHIYFGAENVYDYSGKNKFTDDISNYYEQSHFKPALGNKILEEIYSK